MENRHESGLFLNTFTTMIRFWKTFLCCYIYQFTLLCLYLFFYNVKSLFASLFLIILLAVPFLLVSLLCNTLPWHQNIQYSKHLSQVLALNHLLVLKLILHILAESGCTELDKIIRAWSIQKKKSASFWPDNSCSLQSLQKRQST